MPPRVAPKGKGTGRGKGQPPVVPRASAVRVTRAKARGARDAPDQAEAVPDHIPRRMTAAEARAAVEAEIRAGVYADDPEEDESVAPPYIPEVGQPAPPVEIVVPPGPTTAELVTLISASIAEAFRAQNAELRGPACSGIMREFLRMTPPTFHGGPDFMAAESWYDQTLKALEAIRVTDDATRILLATYQLRDAADLWWKSVKDTRDVTTMRWTRFQQLFLELYFPKVVRDQLKEEFLDCNQLTTTVAEYEVRFTSL